MPSDACMSLVAMAIKSGHTQVTIKLKVMNVVLQTSVTIAAYPLLKVCGHNCLVLKSCYHGSQLILKP